jgi:alpha-D-xyloside xylohydrolase
MMRALGFDFGYDPAALRVEDQFMLGPALLVCPVTAPGVTTRPVYLPAGTQWVNVWDGTVHEGGTFIDASASLETIPVFARAGSILPLDHGVLVFPGADGTFVLYDDAGDGWGYETGEYTRVTLRWNDTDRILTVGPCAGGYPGAPATRHLRARLVGPGTGWRPDDAYTGYAEGEHRDAYLRLRL